VTQALWIEVMTSNPSHFQGEQRPVERVNWEQCEAFCAALGTRVSGLQPRLPTEVEWERACRAGKEGPRWGARLDDVAWHRGNSGGTTHPVRAKQPNPWGLYDILGNVWEWCSDTPMSYSDAEQPVFGGADRGFRGGSFNNDARLVRAAYRSASHPSNRIHNLGFRLARGQAPGGGAQQE